MSKIEECFGKLRDNEAYKDFSDEQIKKILSEIDTHVNKPDYASMSKFQRDRAIRNEELRAAMKIKEAVSSKELKHKFGLLTKAGLKDYEVFDAITAGSHANIEGANINYYAHRQTIKGKWLYTLSKAISKNDMKIISSGEFDSDIARVMEAINKKLPMPEVPANILKIGQNLHKLNAMMVNDLQNLGVFIKKRDDFLWRQSHNQDIIRKTDKATWKKDIAKELDETATFEDIIDPREREKILDSIYKDITEGEFENQIGQFGGRRVLHFKDAESYVRYNTKYGNGTAIDVIRQTIDSASKYGAAAKILGPDPAAGWARLKKLAIDNAKAAGDEELVKSLKAKSIGSQGRRIDNLYREIFGYDRTPEKNMYVKTMQNVKIISAMAKLGKAWATTFTDYAMAAVHYSKMSGEFTTPIKPMLNALKNMVSKEDRNFVARAFGMYTDDIMTGTYDRMGMMGNVAGKQGMFEKFANKVMSLNMLQHQANANRAGMAKMYSALVARQVNKQFSELPAVLRSNLARYGMNEDMWKIMKHGTEDYDGLKFVTGEAISEIPDDIIREYATKRNITIGAAREEARLAINTFVGDQSRLDSPEAGILERGTILQGFSPDSVEGITISSMFQFKTFALSANRVLKHISLLDPAVKGKDWGDILRQQGGLQTVAQLGAYMVPMAMLGLAVRDVVSGQTPRDFSKPENMLDAMTRTIIPLQLSMFLDIARGEYQKFGRDFSKDLLGPVFGQSSDLANIMSSFVTDSLGTAEDRPKYGKSGKKALDFITNNLVPSLGVAGFFWTPVFHRHVTDEAREFLSPGYKDRKILNNSKKGQTALY